MNKEITIYPWNLSKTGQWSPETGIYYLRDNPPEQLAEWFLEMDDEMVLTSAIVELMVHGNPRKAAQIAQIMVQKNSDLEKSLRKSFGDLSEYFLDKDIELLPGSPAEYPKDVKISFFQ